MDMHEAERPLHQLGSNRIKSKKIHGTTIYVLKTTIDLRLSKPTTRMLHRRRRPIGEPLAHLRFNGQHPETDPHYLLLLNLRLLGMTDHVTQQVLLLLTNRSWPMIPVSPLVTCMATSPKLFLASSLRRVASSRFLCQQLACTLVVERKATARPINLHFAPPVTQPCTWSTTRLPDQQVGYGLEKSTDHAHAWMTISSSMVLDW
jgi:hypothetical protein